MRVKLIIFDLKLQLYQRTEPNYTIENDHGSSGEELSVFGESRLVS